MSNLLTISYGTNPELMEATLRILMEAGAVLEIEAVQVGEEMKKLGFDMGFDEDVLQKIRCSKVLLKGVNPDVDTRDLCAALAIENDAENFGDGENAAQGFVSDEYAIFEPLAANAPAMLNAALMVLKHLQQLEAFERIQKALAEVEVNNAMTEDEFADGVISKLY